MEKIQALPEASIICLNETWLKEGDSIQLPDYKDINFYVKDLHKNAKRGCGGISVYIHNSMDKIGTRLLKGHENIAWVEVPQSDRKPLAVGFIYFPPNHSANDYFQELENDLIWLATTHETIVMGDFNAHTNNCSDYSFDEHFNEEEMVISDSIRNKYVRQRSSMDTRPLNEYGKQLLDVCITSNHLILNGRADGDKLGKFTRITEESRGVLDYALCSISYLDHIQGFRVGDLLPESDHCGIQIELSIHNNNEVTSCMNHIPCTKFQVRTDQIDHLRITVQTSLEQHAMDIYTCMSDNKPVNYIVDQFQNLFINCANLCCRKIVTKKPHSNKVHKKPWVDDELQRMRKEIAKANQDNDIEAINNLCKSYNIIKKKKKSQYKANQMAEFDRMCQENDSNMWSKFKEITKKSSSVKLDPAQVYDKLAPLSNPPIEDYFNKRKEKEAQAFIEQYCQGLIDFDGNFINDILNEYISDEEVLCAIKKLKKGKSPGLDGLPAELLIYTSDIVCSHLKFLYNHILDRAEYPDQWAEGLRVAIPRTMELIYDQ